MTHARMRVQITLVARSRDTLSINVRHSVRDIYIFITYPHGVPMSCQGQHFQIVSELFLSRESEY